MFIKVAPTNEVKGVTRQWRRGILAIPWDASPAATMSALRRGRLQYIQAMQARGWKLLGFIREKWATEPILDQSGASREIHLWAPFLIPLRDVKLTVDESLIPTLLSEHPNKYRLLE